MKITFMACSDVDCITLLQNSCFSIATPPDLRDWTKMAETYDNLANSVGRLICNYIWYSCLLFKEWVFALYIQVRIALVGKYVGLTDSYLSVVKVLYIFYMF